MNEASVPEDILTLSESLRLEMVPIQERYLDRVSDNFLTTAIQKREKETTTMLSFA